MEDEPAMKAMFELAKVAVKTTHIISYIIMLTPTVRIFVIMLKVIIAVPFLLPLCQ